MKFNKNWLVYLGLSAVGLGGVLYMMYKKSGKSFAQIGTDNIIGTGGMDNSPTQDTIKSTNVIQAKVNPHDSYSSILDRKSISAYDDIDASWLVNF